MGDSSIISGRLQNDFNSYVFDKVKKQDTSDNPLKTALADNKISKEEYESLKKEYTGSDNKLDADFDKSLMKTLGITEKRLDALKGAENSPVEIKFETKGNTTTVDSDDKSHKDPTLKIKDIDSAKAQTGSTAVSGAFFSKVELKPDTKNQGLDAQATLPKISFDSKRFIDLDRAKLPKDVAYVGNHPLPITSPLDRPSFYVGGHASIKGNSECEVDCGLTWDRVYEKIPKKNKSGELIDNQGKVIPKGSQPVYETARPTFTDKNVSGTDNGDPAKRYICLPVYGSDGKPVEEPVIENGKQKIGADGKPVTKTKVVYQTCEENPKVVAGEGSKPNVSVEDFEKNIQPNYAFRPFWRYDINSKLNSSDPVKDQDIRLGNQRYKVEQNGKDFSFADKDGKKHDLATVINVNGHNYSVEKEMETVTDKKDPTKKIEVQKTKEINGVKYPLFSYVSEDNVKHAVIKNDKGEFLQSENQWNNPKTIDADNVYFYPGQMTNVKLGSDNNGKITLSIGEKFSRSFDVPGYQKGSERSFKLVNSIDQRIKVADGKDKGNENLPAISTSTTATGGTWKATSIDIDGNKNSMMPNGDSIRGSDTLGQDFDRLISSDGAFRTDIDPNENIHKYINQVADKFKKDPDKNKVIALSKYNDADKIESEAKKVAKSYAQDIWKQMVKDPLAVPFKEDSKEAKALYNEIEAKIAIAIKQLAREIKRGNNI